MVILIRGFDKDGDYIVNRSWLLTCLLAPVSISALGLSQQDYMQNMQKAQACMAQVDQSALKRFEGEARTAESKIKALCAEGKRDEAQSEAMVFARQTSSQPDIAKMRKWMELMRGMMPAAPYFGPQEGSTDHVCDG